MLRQLLDEEGVYFELVLTSPKDRTKETAALLCGKAVLKEMEELSPSSDPHRALSIIPRDLDVLVVSHNPLLTGIATGLGESIIFEPGTLAMFNEKGLHKVITP